MLETVDLSKSLTREEYVESLIRYQLQLRDAGLPTVRAQAAAGHRVRRLGRRRQGRQHQARHRAARPARL